MIQYFMKQYLFLLWGITSLIFSSLFLACSDDEPGDKTPVFTIKEEYLQQDFDQKQSSLVIPVETNLAADAWVVSSNQDWCVAAKDMSGSSPAVKVLVHANEEPDVRSAEITLKSSVQNYTIQVRQLGYGPAILVKNPNPIIDAAGGPLSIIVTSNIEYTIEQSENSDWIKTVPATRALTDKEYQYTVDANPYYETRTVTFTYIYTKDDKIRALCSVTQNAKDSGVSDVEIEGDLKISPNGGKDSEHQPGQGIENSFDGKFGGTPYHSIWNQKANFPVTLEYFFDGTKDIDYLIYHTRSGNGNFGKLDIYTATEDAPEYTKYGSFDFKMQNASSRVVFAQSLKKATKIKFEVHSGLGDFVSCDEMEFYQKNPDKKLDAQLLGVFTDITCTEVRDEATDAQINALPGYFANIAIQLKRNTYDEWEKSFRIQDYHPYSNVEEWAETQMTKRYSNIDNPTGIYVEAGDSVIVLVGDTHGQSLSIQCIGEEKSGDYVQTAASGETRFLEEGVNKLGFTQRGMLFLMYNTNLQDVNAKPVKIHIPLGSGYVSGFFDVKTDKTNDKYKELINKATYKYFCIRGERIMFYFHRDKMMQAVPYDILSAINLWDDIISWQQELMGIDDVRPSQVNNHLFAISPEGSYMWASDYRIGFVYTYLNNILLYDNVMAAKDNAWGPAHEIGHIHQRAINWPSSTESSNNLFSNYILFKLGKYCSRGSELSALAKARFVDKQAWWNMGSATHQNEDTEIHMRMNWQLWNYYHRCGYKTDFWQKLFKLLREDRIVESNPGAGQLHFAKMASKAANENLTEFFRMWGFLEPVINVEIEQYGKWNYNVTPTMIAEAVSYMSQFPAPKHAFYYLEDRKNNDVGIEQYQVGDVGYYTQFKNDQKITKNVTYTRSGQHITISSGDEAVAFEVKKGSEIMYFSNFFSFDIPASIPWNDSMKIYAVQANGERKEVKSN